MAKIKVTEELPVTALVISENQARIRGIESEIDELTESIRVHGLLEPIVVCPSSDNDGYEVLLGQRRLLAHKRLGMETILAAIIDEPVDKLTAKVLSLTENLIRQNLDAKDIIDACTALYHKYGNAKAVALETGLPYPTVLRHVKYDRLVPGMQTLVDEGDVKIDLALKVQDAVATTHPEVNEVEAVELARRLAPLTVAQQGQVLRKRKSDPEKSVKDLLESIPKSERSKQIVVTLSSNDLRRLQTYAQSHGTTQDQAAAAFIVSGLAARPPMAQQRAARRVS